jgi:DNA-binding IclR family transcriptional regulator
MYYLRGQKMESVTLKITNATEQILDVLQEGRATPGYIQRETGLARNTVHNQLNVLLAADVVVYVDEPTGLYELVEDPRDESKQ